MSELKRNIYGFENWKIYENRHFMGAAILNLTCTRARKVVKSGTRQHIRLTTLSNHQANSVWTRTKALFCFKTPSRDTSIRHKWGISSVKMACVARQPTTAFTYSANKKQVSFNFKNWHAQCRSAGSFHFHIKGEGVNLHECYLSKCDQWSSLKI